MKIVRRIVFSVLCLGTLLSAAYFSFGAENPNNAMTGIYLTFSLFMIAFGWPEIAESISFLGNSIKLRDVKKAIDELKPLAEVFSTSVLELMQGGSRWGGIPEEEREKTYVSIEKMLGGLSFTEKEIEKIQKRWHEWIEIDYAHAIMSPHSNINHPEVPKEKQALWHVAHSRLKEKWPNLAPSEIRSAFIEIGCLTPQVEVALSDYEFYKKNKKHRDIERWRQRKNWFSK